MTYVLRRSHAAEHEHQFRRINCRRHFKVYAEICPAFCDINSIVERRSHSVFFYRDAYLTRSGGFCAEAEPVSTRLCNIHIPGELRRPGVRRGRIDISLEAALRAGKYRAALSPGLPSAQVSVEARVREQVHVRRLALLFGGYQLDVDVPPDLAREPLHGKAMVAGCKRTAVFAIYGLQHEAAVSGTASAASKQTDITTPTALFNALFSFILTPLCSHKFVQSIHSSA